FDAIDLIKPLVYVGDALGDISASFAQPIDVVPGAQSRILFADKEGGPVGAEIYNPNANPHAIDDANRIWNTDTDPFARTYTADAPSINAVPVRADSAGNWLSDYMDNEITWGVAEVDRIDSDAPLGSTISGYEEPPTPDPGNPIPALISFAPNRAGN